MEKVESHFAKVHGCKEGDDFNHLFKQHTTNGVQNGLKLLWDEFKLSFRRNDVNSGV